MLLNVLSTRGPFRSIEQFSPPDPGYRLLPFRFLRWSDDDVLLTNDVGEFLVLPESALRDLVAHRLPADSAAFLDLEARHFLASGESDVPLELLATKYRTKKSFLDGFTRLHLFVVTLRCDHSCRYCQVSRVTENRSRYDMSRETAERSIDLMFRSPAPALKIEFQGGEALLNFDLVQWIVERVEERNQIEGRRIEFVVATNLSPLTDAMLDFLRDHDVLISTSLDGPAQLHDRNRPRRGGGSHAVTVENLRKAREALGHDRVSAIMTTSEASLALPCEIIDEYVRLGFDAIFLRPISPYGFAVRTGEAARYQALEFLDFYRRGLDHVIELNRRGTPFIEVYAQILLTKILTPFATGYVDLQSPAGTGIGAVVYNYDGDVYASDESRMLAEMGDRSFRLGNVHTDAYEDIFGGEVLHDLVRRSIAEALPGCSDCAFLPYCGADPVFHHRTQRDLVGHRPTSAFCTKNMGILRHLFNLLIEGDDFTRELLASWATDVGAELDGAPDEAGL
jgi:His-Xaa-Ser system radical SAM maturase HxsB